MSHVLALLLLLAPGAKNYDIQATAPPASAGKTGKATVRVVTKNGFHVNKDYPTSLEVSGSAGVTLPRAKLAKADARLGENEAEFDVPFVAGKAGKAQLEATFRFAVCTDKDCFPAKEKVTIALDVK